MEWMIVASEEFMVVDPYAYGALAVYLASIGVLGLVVTLARIYHLLCCAKMCSKWRISRWGCACVAQCATW